MGKQNAHHTDKNMSADGLSGTLVCSHLAAGMVSGFMVSSRQRLEPVVYCVTKLFC